MVDRGGEEVSIGEHKMGGESITIGIPSYNEGENLIKILEQLREVSMECREKIKEIIISDDSTDNTDAIIRRYLESRDYPYKVIYKHHPNRRGKAVAWNEIFEEAAGNYIILYDADIIIDKRNPCKLVEKLKRDREVGAVGARTVSLQRRSLAAEASRIIGLWLHQVRTVYPESQYTLMGRCICIRREIAEKTRIPREVIADDLYLQCRVKELGYSISYLEDAIIFFKPPVKIREFISQVVRGVIGHKQIERYIERYIPQKLEIMEHTRTIYQLAKKHGLKPLIITLIAFTAGLVYLPLIWRSTIKNTWMIAKTSK
jgi:cellulose synthase/poly-beta-1,6-N-acetylglucosamine synthase-like glycosyltransferase